MKCLLDSSVLVAACVQTHPNHIPALNWLKKAKKKEVEAHVSAHSILETCSVLTRAPFQPKISPSQAYKLIETNILPYTKSVSVGGRDYTDLIKKLSENKLAGGVVYDALILFAAHKHKITYIVTSNTKDFERLLGAFKYDLIIEIL